MLKSTSVKENTALQKMNDIGKRETCELTFTYLLRYLLHLFTKTNLYQCAISSTNSMHESISFVLNRDWVCKSVVIYPDKRSYSLIQGLLIVGINRCKVWKFITSLPFLSLFFGCSVSLLINIVDKKPSWPLTLIFPLY